VIFKTQRLFAPFRRKYSICRLTTCGRDGETKNNADLITQLERFEVAYVKDRADLYWEWGTSLRRRTSELDLMACKAHVARPAMVTASGHADLEGVY
jgi:hypothetical protein